jgi:hypothetical protein
MRFDTSRFQSSVNSLVFSPSKMKTIAILTVTVLSSMAFASAQHYGYPRPAPQGYYHGVAPPRPFYHHPVPRPTPPPNFYPNRHQMFPHPDAERQRWLAREAYLAAQRAAASQAAQRAYQYARPAAQFGGRMAGGAASWFVPRTAEAPTHR